jgi:hypothetical protein
MAARKGGGGAGVDGQRISRHLWPSRCRALQHRTPIGLCVVFIYFLIRILSNNITVQYSNNEGILYDEEIF